MGKKKKKNQNNAQQHSENTDQTSAVQLYLDPTKTLDHIPSFPSHTQNSHQSPEDSNCGVTHTQSTETSVRTWTSPAHWAKNKACLSFLPSTDSGKKKKESWYLITVSFTA